MAGWRRWAVLLVAAAGALVATAGPAGAVINGPCQGSGDFQKGGFTVNATEKGVVTVPLKDDVSWKGSITGVSGERTYAGAIRVDLPPPFGTYTVDSWGGKTTKTSNSGVKHYDLPSAIPRGVEFKVKGFHNDKGVSCSGFVRLQVKGGAFDSPVSYGSIIGAVIFAGLLLLAARGHAVLGAIAGFFLGLFLSGMALSLGLVDLDSIVLTLLPIIGLVVGLLLGLAGPLGRSAEPA